MISFRRYPTIALTWLIGVGVAASCAESDDSNRVFPSDAALESSSGGFGGTGTGGVGTGGTGGKAGTSGASGTSGSSSGGTDGGACNAAFCPNNGSGTPCCVTPEGPCGTDPGTGSCTANPTQDGGGTGGTGFGGTAGTGFGGTAGATGGTSGAGTGGTAGTAGGDAASDATKTDSGDAETDGGDAGDAEPDVSLDAAGN